MKIYGCTVKYTTDTNSHSMITAWFTVQAIDYRGACTLATYVLEEKSEVPESNIVELKIVDLTAR